jgi:hypothetical protein
MANVITSDGEQREIKDLRKALDELDSVYDQDPEDFELVVPTARVVRHLARLFLWAHNEGRI